MKWSLYNEIIDYSDKGAAYIYNIRNNIVYNIDKVLLNILQKCLNNIVDLKAIHPELFKSMIVNKLIVEDYVDEYQECLNYVNARLKSDKFNI